MTKLLRQAKQHHDVVLVALATIIGAIVRFGFITKASIWHDEGFSIMLAARTPAQIWATTARDVHPPLYYELLHLWGSLFGTSVLALRSLSALAGIAIVPLGFVIVRRMASRRAALLASFVLALAPFLIRYSQEVRMYGLLGLLMLLAFYAVIRIVEKPLETRWYMLYTFTIALGLYTHYFAALAVIAFWFYFIILQSPRRWKIGSTILLSARWWLANIVAVILFLPWAPSAITQIRRGQGLSWLSKTTITSFHDAIWQFFTFTDAHKIIQLFYWLVPIIIIAAAVYLILTDKTKEKYSRLLVCYSLVPMFLALVVSVQKPIFHERYFAFAAIGIYIIVAITADRLASKRAWLFGLLSALILCCELVGIRNVYMQANHQMNVEMARINSGFQAEENIIAGELYVYFDGSYYNKTDKQMLLYTGANMPNGYGESALLYDQNVYLPDFTTIALGQRVWLVGKTGSHDYYDQVPPNWKLLQQTQAGYSEVRLYLVQ